MIRITIRVLLLAVLLPATVAWAEESPDQAAEAQLAERVVDLAQRVLRDKTVTDLNWQQARELLKAAARLNPNEPRFFRLIADISLQMKDIPAAKDALKSYRALNDKDTVAQVQLVELYASGYETADAKLNYLKDILGRTGIADEVRSHAALLCVRLLREQGQDAAADNMLDQSLRLFPLNADSLRLKLEQVRAKGTPLEHTAVLLAMLKSNPAQPEILQELADQLSTLALNESANVWYNHAFQLSRRSGRFDPDNQINYAGALFIQDRAQDAQTLCQEVLKVRPENVEMQFLRVLLAKGSPKQDELPAARTLALNALYNQLAVVRGKLGVSGATTRPFDSSDAPAIPDLRGDADLLNKAGKPELTVEYVRAASDLAWFNLYFQADAAAADKVIAVLKSLLPAESLTLNRLLGWSAYVAGRTDEAKAKFSELDDRDALAAMGLVLILDSDPAQKDKARAMARSLISRQATGLRGALLWDALRDRGGKIVLGEVAEAVKAELEKFPMEFLRIIDLPQNFYSIRGEPLQASYGFCEPMLATVTLQNMSDFDLTIGPEGVIKPDLWFDAQIKGLVQQGFPGIAYDRFAQNMVLRPRTSLSQVVRVDRGNLYQAMSSNPTLALQVSVLLTTNPVMSTQAVMSGPGGYRQQFSRLFSRLGARMVSDEDKQRTYRLLAEGTAGQKFYTLELLASYANLFRAKETTDQLKQVGNEFVEVVNRARRDASPAVATWAGYISTKIQSGDTRPEVIKQMLKSDHWATRFTGVLTAQELPADQAKDLLAMTANDKDASVQALSGIVVELVAHPTTQSTSQPATLPVKQPRVDSFGHPE